MIEVGFLEIAFNTVNQIKLPYATGLIWSYCKDIDKIRDNFNLDISNWIYVNDDVDVIVDKLKNINILGVSNFVWNTNINEQICKKLKTINPDCLVVYGGLGNPKYTRCKEFLDEKPFIDLVAHGEGEKVFANILLEYLNEKDYNKVKGVSTRNGFTGLEQRINNLNEMPSPYLNGLFDKIIQNETRPFKFEATIETVRGCPYKCTYCEIGDSFFTKIKKQENKKVKKEIDWISNNKIEFIYNADSNFGMFPEHLEVAQHLTLKKKQTGFPDNIRIDWAKNKKPFLFKIAKTFADADMMKGVTIALQTMNYNTLKAIQRTNIERKTLKELVQTYNDNNIACYIELILGLPEETVDSFKQAIYEILDDVDFHDYVGMYHMTALPNTPFHDPEYIQKYGIKFAETAPAFFHHDDPNSLLKEKEIMVVETNTMSINDYIEMSLFRWFFLSFHFLGWLRVISKCLKNDYHVSYQDFYENLYKYFIDNKKGLIYSEYKKTKKCIERILNKEQVWGRKIDSVCHYYWEFEEATCISIIKNKDEFYNDISKFITSTYKINVDESIEYQKYSIKDPFTKYPLMINIGSKKYTVKSENYDGNIEEWCRINFWWGRRNKKFFTEIKQHV